MPALTGITAVRPTENTKSRLVKYGATIAAGQPLYQDPADAEMKLSDADASATTATLSGVAITPGVDNGWGYVAYGGSIILVGATMTQGVSYFSGDVPGTIVPEGDLNTGDRVSLIGIAASATELQLAITNTGIVK
jgi:hypothetical protein